MVGGGDQIYCDGYGTCLSTPILVLTVLPLIPPRSLTRELEMQEWVGLKTNAEKVSYPVSEEMRIAIDRFYFNHYCSTFRSGMFARCNRSM